MKDFDPERLLPDSLVTTPASARWLDEEVTGNPTRVGVLADVPARSMEFYLQEIPAGEASDLQRHLHESVHCVVEGSGFSEIGQETSRWQAGDFIYTPPWVWHRHYNDGGSMVRMILVENSKLLDTLGINRRESAGNIAYGELATE
jgi:gentisate 1,2-dioxygenase